MVDASVAKRLVEAIIGNLPAPVPGRRPVHTIGVGVKGEFVASDVARTYCIAEHFQGRPVPVSMRFSNGLGGLEQHDGPTLPLVRRTYDVGARSAGAPFARARRRSFHSKMPRPMT